MRPVRKEKLANHLLVFLRKILNLNFILDMSFAIPAGFVQISC